MREIEIKIRADNLKELERRLPEKGCRLSAPVNQHDVIYSRAGSKEEWEEAKEGHVVLRLRNENGKFIFNLKQQRSAELDNIEYETEVADKDATNQILLILGWTPEVEVKKVRRRGKLGDYEICLDEVEELGSYVELEKLTEADDPDKVKEELFQVLESLGLSRNDEETRGYDTQIYQLHKKSGI